jgi:hypothetical protein
MFNNVFGKKLKLGERKKKFESYKRFLKKTWAQIATS